MKLTINEIAEMAHVAKSTVSKAINGQKGVSESNRQRILEIIQQVNFQPNVSARALAQSRTGAIGIVLPHSVTSLSGTFWATVVSAVAAEANRHRQIRILNSFLNITFRYAGAAQSRCPSLQHSQSR